jgi:hypothetical protein
MPVRSDRVVMAVRPWPVSAHYCWGDEGHYVLRAPLADGRTVLHRLYVSYQPEWGEVDPGSAVRLPVTQDAPILALYVPADRVRQPTASSPDFAIAAVTILQICPDLGRASEIVGGDLLTHNTQLHARLLRVLPIPALPSELWEAYPDVAATPQGQSAPPPSLAYDLASDVHQVLWRLRNDHRMVSSASAVRFLARRAGWTPARRQSVQDALDCLVLGESGQHIAAMLRERKQRAVGQAKHNDHPDTLRSG